MKSAQNFYPTLKIEKNKLPKIDNMFKDLLASREVIERP